MTSCILFQTAGGAGWREGGEGCEAQFPGRSYDGEHFGSIKCCVQFHFEEITTEVKKDSLVWVVWWGWGPSDVTLVDFLRQMYVAVGKEITYIRRVS